MKWILLILCSVLPMMIGYSTSAQSGPPEEFRFVFLVSQSTILNHPTMDDNNDRTQAVLNAIEYVYTFYNEVLERAAPGQYVISIAVMYFGQEEHIVEFDVRGNQLQWIDFQTYRQNQRIFFEDDFQGWRQLLNSLDCSSETALQPDFDCTDHGADHHGAFEAAFTLLQSAPNRGGRSQNAIFVLSDGVDCGDAARVCTYTTNSSLQTRFAALEIRDTLQTTSPTPISFIALDRAVDGYFHTTYIEWEETYRFIDFIPAPRVNSQGGYRLSPAERITQIGRQATSALIGAINRELFEEADIFPLGLPAGVDIYEFNPDDDDLTRLELANANNNAQNNNCAGNEIFVRPLVNDLFFYMMQYDSDRDDLLAFASNNEPPQRWDRRQDRRNRPLPIYRASNMSAFERCYRPTLQNTEQFNFDSNNYLLAIQQQVSLEDQTAGVVLGQPLRLYQYENIALQAELVPLAPAPDSMDNLELRAVLRSDIPGRFSNEEFTLPMENPAVSAPMIAKHPGRQWLHYELWRVRNPNNPFQNIGEARLIVSAEQEVVVEPVNFDFGGQCAGHDRNNPRRMRPGEMIDFSVEFTTSASPPISSGLNLSPLVQNWGMVTTVAAQPGTPLQGNNMPSLAGVQGTNGVFPILQQFSQGWRVPNVETTYLFEIQPIVGSMLNTVQLPSIACAVRVQPLILSPIDYNPQTKQARIRTTNREDAAWIDSLPPNALTLEWKVEPDPIGEWANPSQTFFESNGIDVNDASFAMEATRDFSVKPLPPGTFLSFRVLYNGAQIYPVDSDYENTNGTSTFSDTTQVLP